MKLNFTICSMCVVAALLITLNTLIPNSMAAEESYFIELHIAPDKIARQFDSLPIGYVNIVNEEGIPLVAKDDLEINLKSSQPLTATVPKKIVIPAGQSYVNFDISTIREGDVEISASFEDQVVSAMLKIGGAKQISGDFLKLKIQLPTSEGHLNTEMPFAVYLEDIDGDAIAPSKDLTVNITYEKKLIRSENDTLVIKEGNYYAYSKIHILDKVGGAFIKAEAPELELDAAERINISSTKPTKLIVDVFPNRIAESTERNVSIFISLRDSNDNPTLAERDVRLNINADTQVLSERIDDVFKDIKPIIKKDEFGFYFQPNLVFTSFPQNYTVIVTSDDYGLATKRFDIVEILNSDSPKAKDKTVKVFVPEKIPVGAKAIVTYQAGAIERDDDDPEDLPEAVEDRELQIRTIDDLEAGEIFPIKPDQVFSSEKLVDNLSVVSSDNEILRIDKVGSIVDTKKLLGVSSFGTSEISTGKKTGTVEISVAMKGFASGTASTQVINTREISGTKIFSPLGQDRVTSNRDGTFDIFFVPVDASDRPSTSESGLNYVVTPINKITEIPAGDYFSRMQIDKSLFSSINFTEITVSPIGVSSVSEIASSTTLFYKPSLPALKVILPFEKIPGLTNVNNIGTVQITDLFDNPIFATEDIDINLISSDNSIGEDNISDSPIVKVPELITIPAGSSFVKFPITTTHGNIGPVLISASASNAMSSEAELDVEHFSSDLIISPEYPTDPIKINEPVTLKVFVDDDFGNSIQGATVVIKAPNGTAVPDRLTTSELGEAAFIYKSSIGPANQVLLTISKLGYDDVEKTLDLTIEGGLGSGQSSLAFGLPIWAIYAGIIGVIATIGAVVFIFIRKPKEKETEEETEEI